MGGHVLLIDCVHCQLDLALIRRLGGHYYTIFSHIRPCHPHRRMLRNTGCKMFIALKEIVLNESIITKVTNEPFR